MNSTQIAYFLTVAKYLSFSESSRQLFIAQSAISKQILSLENELNLKLFERTSRSVTLTPAGEVLYRELQKYDEWLSNIISMARQAEQGKTGMLNVGILHGIDLSNPNITQLHAFAEAHPDIHVDIRRLTFHDVDEELKSGQSDIFIVLSFLLPNIPTLPAMVLDSNEDYIAVSKESPLGRMEVVAPEDLPSYTLITISPEISRQAHINSLNFLRGLGVYPENIRYVKTIEDIVLSVESGLGYAVISSATRIFDREFIRILDIYPEGLPRQITNIVAVWNKNKKNPAVMQYINFILGIKDDIRTR